MWNKDQLQVLNEFETRKKKHSIGKERECNRANHELVLLASNFLLALLSSLFLDQYEWYHPSGMDEWILVQHLHPSHLSRSPRLLLQFFIRSYDSIHLYRTQQASKSMEF